MKAYFIIFCFPNKNAKGVNFLTHIVGQQGNYWCQLSHLLKYIPPLIFYKILGHKSDEICFKYLKKYNLALSKVGGIADIERDKYKFIGCFAFDIK